MSQFENTQIFHAVHNPPFGDEHVTRSRPSQLLRPVPVVQPFKGFRRFNVQRVQGQIRRGLSRFGNDRRRQSDPRRQFARLGSDLGLWKGRVYWAAISSWDIFSATPSGKVFSPVLRAVPNLSISHDETFSLGAGASFAAATNLSA